jgi:hypothetical protein
MKDTKKRVEFISSLFYLAGQRRRRIVFTDLYRIDRVCHRYLFNMADIQQLFLPLIEYVYLRKLLPSISVKSNLCTTTIFGTQNLWPLLTGGRCSEVCYISYDSIELGLQNCERCRQVVVAIRRRGLIIFAENETTKCDTILCNDQSKRQWFPLFVITSLWLFSIVCARQ